MKERINPNLSHEQWESLLSLAAAYAENSRNQEFAGRLHELNHLFILEDNWKAIALQTLSDLISKENSTPSDDQYYREALTSLCDFCASESLAEELKNNLLILFNTAYHLGLYEFSDSKLAEVGISFKLSLSDNRNPINFAGSIPGYSARLQNYVGGQILFHKDEIANIVSQNIASEAPVVKRRPA